MCVTFSAFLVSNDCKFLLMRWTSMLHRVLIILRSDENDSYFKILTFLSNRNDLFSYATWESALSSCKIQPSGIFASVLRIIISYSKLRYNLEAIIALITVAEANPRYENAAHYKNFPLQLDHENHNRGSVRTSCLLDICLLDICLSGQSRPNCFSSIKKTFPNLHRKIKNVCRITISDGGAVALEVPILVIEIALKIGCRCTKIISLFASHWAR